MKATVDRVRAEFLEMPGLRLTRDQIGRLCGLTPAMGAFVLDALVSEGFLCANPDGTFARLTEGSPRSLRSAKAALHNHRRRRAS